MNHFITLNNKKYAYILKPIDKEVTFVECKAANIAQEFLNEDIPQLLIDLPNLILAEKKYKEQQSDVIRFRVSPEDKKEIEKKAVEAGYASVSSFLRSLALSA